MSIRQLKERIWRRLLRHSSISGIAIAVVLSSKAETKAMLKKIEAALNLMQQCDLRRMTYLKRDVKRILVWGSPEYNGAWHQETATCELAYEFVQSPDTTPAILAATLAHEAMHARLMCWGFGYDEQIRVRIEAVCIKASMSFARRLPLSEMASRGYILWSGQQKLEFDTSVWSDQGRLEAKAAALLELGCPEWRGGCGAERGATEVNREHVAMTDLTTHSLKD